MLFILLPAHFKLPYNTVNIRTFPMIHDVKVVLLRDLSLGHAMVVNPLCHFCQPT